MSCNAYCLWGRPGTGGAFNSFHIVRLRGNITQLNKLTHTCIHVLVECYTWWASRSESTVYMYAVLSTVSRKSFVNALTLFGCVRSVTLPHWRFTFTFCGLHPELLCGLLKETSAGLEQRLGGGKATREWDRMFTKARYMYICTYTVQYIVMITSSLFNFILVYIHCVHDYIQCLLHCQVPCVN